MPASVLAILLAACTTWFHVGNDFDLNAFTSHVNRGVTTKDQVRAWLGAPTVPVVELVQDRVCRGFVVAQTDCLSEVRDREVRDIKPGTIGTRSEPPEWYDQWLEVSAVEDDGAFFFAERTI
jgi:hypothetical protein